jgi:hypothetical protein
MSEHKQCEATLASAVFSHHAYGDPLPIWERFVGEDNAVARDEAIEIYIRCERPAGHTGKHLARGTRGWA